MNADTIRSRENPVLKRFGAVLAGKDRSKLALEGDRLIDDALAAGWELDAVLVASDREARATELESRGAIVRRVEAHLLERLSRLRTPPGIGALCSPPKEIDPNDMVFGSETLLLVVAGVADPGNLGALARSAEAFGAQAMLVASGGASPWNDKALRGSMGSMLRMPVASGLDAHEIVRLLQTRGVRQARAATRDGADPARFDWSGPIALWVGGETGDFPRAAETFETLTIPMKSGVESLNVTVAASLLLFAAGRVRNGG